MDGGTQSEHVSASRHLSDGHTRLRPGENADRAVVAEAFEEAITRLWPLVLGSVRSERSWHGRVRAGLLTLLTFLDEEPALGRVLIVDVLSAGDQLLERRQQVVRRLTEVLAAGTERERTARQNVALRSPLIAEGLVGAVLSVIHTRMLVEDERPFVELAPSLMSMIVLPYLGPAAAGRELVRSRTAAAADSDSGSRACAPPRRATYRTALVLDAIACAPHSSNREIALAAGLSDEGQASKLLSRLQRQGLIENVGLGQPHGEPNAWLLTSAGRNVAAVSNHALQSQVMPLSGRAVQRSRRGL